MKPALRTSFRFWLLACAVLVLTACSAIKFTYNNADTVIRLAAWDYLDLERAQEDEFKQLIAKYMDWHRREEMPAIAKLAGEVIERTSRRIAVTDVVWVIEQARARYRKASARAAEDASPVLATLNEDQLKGLQKKFTKANTKYEKEFLSGDEAKRVKARRKRIVDNIEEWTGDLTDAQEARVDQFVRAHPRSAEIRMVERLRWQAEVISVLRSNREPAALAMQLGAVFAEPERGRSDEYLRETKRWEADLAQMVVELEATFTPEQRRRATHRLAGLAKDIRELAGDASRPQAKL